ncbi:hypothetical protein IAT40_002233 [Kwoniella sp. CBS 6097]
MKADVHKIHPLAGYTFIERESQPEEDNSVTARLKRLEAQFEESGIRRSVEAIMLVEVHGFPHVLVLQVANAFYKLPGGYLDPSETDAEGLITRLREQLGVPPDANFNVTVHFESTHQGQEGADKEENQTRPAATIIKIKSAKPLNDESKEIQVITSDSGGWEVRDCLSTWWRPNFDTFLYPYVPAHISQPKECKKFYLVELPPNKTFAVPVNMKLHAIPIYEFYDNAARYGPQFAGIPYILSKYTFVKAAPGELKGVTPIKGIFVED